MLVADLLADRLVQVRIEVGAGRVDRRHVPPLQELDELLVNQVEALPVAGQHRIAAAVGGTLGALEIVQHGQELGDQLGGEVVAELAALAIHPLAVVVELGLQAEQAVQRLVALATQRVEFGDRLALRRVGIGLGRVHVCVVHEGSPVVASPTSTRVTAREALSTAAIDREYRMRVGPITPTMPWRPLSA